MKTRILLIVVAQLLMVGLVNGQEKDPWIGKRVFTPFGTMPKVGDAVVDDDKSSDMIRFSDHDRNCSRVYRVEHDKGEWLWLQDEKGGLRGWVQSEYVMPYEKAIDYFTNLILSGPQPAYFNRRGLVRQGKREYDLAIADYNEAIRLDPKYASGFFNRGLAWFSKKELDRAITDFDEAIRLDPKDASAFSTRGVIWKLKKESEKAIADFDEAIRLDPKFSSVFFSRGVAWRDKKEYDRAIADFNELIRLNPNEVWGYSVRARLWATCPDAKYRDGKRAVESATKACELSGWTIAAHLDTLAAAYAESGDFDSAVKWQENAHKLYSDEKKKEWEKLLDLYKAKKPYRAE